MVSGAVGHNNPEDHAAFLSGRDGRPTVPILMGGIRTLDDSAAGALDVRFAHESGHRATRLACPLCANRVLTRRSKSTASLPSPMLINCTQTELDATGRRSRLGTWPTRNGLMPAGLGWRVPEPLL